MKECFHIATTWGGKYTLEVDDGFGFIPKKIKPKRGYYEVIGDEFSVRVYGVAYVKYGDYKKLKENKPAIVELVKG